MKLSTRTKYGTRLMAILALRYGHGPVLLREISEREAISEKYLSQIVIPLRSASLVRSVRGARGGYVLAREPREINLREIVEALEGGIAESEESGANPASLAGLVISGVWRELGAGIARALSEITLEEVVRRVHDAGEHPAMYSI